MSKLDTVTVDLTLEYQFSDEDKARIIEQACAAYKEMWEADLRDEVDSDDPNALFDRALKELLIGCDDWAARIPGELIKWDDVIHHKRNRLTLAA